MPKFEPIIKDKAGDQVKAITPKESESIKGQNDDQKPQLSEKSVEAAPQPEE